MSSRDGGDGLRLIHEAVPSVATGVDDVLVGVIEAVGELVFAKLFPDVLDRIEFGRVERQDQRGDVVRHGHLSAPGKPLTVVSETLCASQRF